MTLYRSNLHRDDNAYGAYLAEDILERDQHEDVMSSRIHEGRGSRPFNVKNPIVPKSNVLYPEGFCLPVS